MRKSEDLRWIPAIRLVIVLSIIHGYMDTKRIRRNMDAFDQAMSRLKKYNHGRCDIYHTGDKVYFICKKPS
jgi:hypothetical protein